MLGIWGIMVWNGELEVDVTKVRDIKETKDLWEFFFFFKQGLIQPKLALNLLCNPG